MQTNLNTLILVREEFYTDRTLGSILFRNNLYVRTLEPPYYPPGHPRHNARRTAVPLGLYRLKFHDSPRFGPSKIYLSDVPHRSGILIHAGNTPPDTTGCILVGCDLRSGRLTESCVALQQLETLARRLHTTHREIFLYITR
ncbi:DUF5675 family protein [Gabonibacter massiliensis]|uniref:DUF5675 family protein n=1 Tax=Gabonibacter massiliensis TaxID=1720195 RepID=UPI0033071118